MQVELLTSNQSLLDMEEFAVRAAQTCYGNEGKGVNRKEFLLRIIGHGHESILEHIYLTYRVSGISRALLQQLARHRHITLSVESTRHTLKKIFSSDDDVLKIAKAFDDDLILGEYAKEDVFYVVRGKILGSIAGLLARYPEIPNDVLKYFLPEFWPTNLIFTVNVRELRHILDLRTAPRALKEFRFLARKLFEAVPDEFKYLLEDCVHKEIE